MRSLYILLIRLILSMLLAWLIGSFFFKEALMIKIISLGLCMFGLAYLFEYTKKRDKGERNGD